MLKIIKIFNNNIALAEEDGKQFVAMGKGIAFQKKPGDVLTESCVEKRFEEIPEDQAQQLSTLLGTVPADVFEMSEHIISNAQEELHTSFDSSIHIGLTDHIYESLIRYQKDQKLKNVLLHEIKRFYPKEFQVALHALDTIYLETYIRMEEDEAGFIAMHFVNGEHNAEMIDETIQISKMMEDIIHIVELSYHIQINQDSLNFTRFVTHIQYFARRLLSKSIISGNETDDLLYAQVRKQYPEAYQCANKIKDYIRKIYDVEITNEEMTYFMLHINRATARN